MRNLFSLASEGRHDVFLHVISSCSISTKRGAPCNCSAFWSCSSAVGRAGILIL